MASFYAIGCMSGSSLDGIDLCYVEFTGDIQTDVWSSRILKAKTLPYTTEWQSKLRNANKLSGEQLIQLHTEYGHFIGETVKNFIQDEDIKNLDCISSHGHTIFHQPSQGYTFQLGDGETTAVHLERPFVCNFRNKDVALGGHGAPLVPNGERFLFSLSDVCINLGGIANIGLKGLQGYDVCPCNYVSNKLANVFDKTLQHDTDGQLAEKGNVLPEVLEKLESLNYYTQLPPKSMGAEWIDNEVLPILDLKEYCIPDLLKTYAEHITNRLAEACRQARDSTRAENVSKNESDIRVLVTGGGAFNTHLMKLFQKKLEHQGFIIENADNDTIEFKEALIFAFLGLRCLLNQENILFSVTGSKSNSISGSIHRPAHSSNTVSRIIGYLMEKNKERAPSLSTSPQ